MQLHAHSPPSPSQVSTHQAAIQTNSQIPSRAVRTQTKTTIDMDSLHQYYEFSPSDARLINAYLRPKLTAGNNNNNDDVTHHSCIIHDADVTSDHPYNLVLNHAPAPGTVGDNKAGKGGVWFFFSPVRYVGGKAARSRKNRARTVLGDGRKKKGAWHTEGKRKMVDGTDGGYLQKLSYHEVTPSGSVVKPGWLMVEYAIEDEHGGGGALVLCKVYRSPRGGPAGPGSSSDVSAAACKRKACVVVEQEQVQEQHRPWKKRITNEEDMFSAANLMRHEHLIAKDCYTPAPAPQEYREAEHVLGSGGESAPVAADQYCTWKAEPDQLVPVPDEGFIQPQQIQQDFHKLLGTDDDDEMQTQMALQRQCAAAQMDDDDDDDDDDVVEISFGDFTASSSAALAGAAPPSPLPPPCAAQPEDVVGSLDQMSSQQQVQLPADEDDDKIEFTFEELMGSSTPGQCTSSSSMSSLLPTDDDDDDDDGMCGLACPPMDYAIVEALLKLGPAIVEEEDFICDLC